MPAGIRPTQGVLRAAIFDLLGHDLEGLSFLELFSGSGAVGMEAISRGAGEVVMVEHDPKCAQVIRDNLELLGITYGGQYRIVHADAFTTVKGFAAKAKVFDIVFLDPPFRLKLAKKALKLIISHDILHAQSFLVLQYDKDDSIDVPEGFQTVTKRLYGDSYLMILQKVR